MTDPETSFRLGYLHVVQVLELARAQPTHLNMHVRNVINETLDVLIKTLKEELDRTVKETFHAKSR